MQQFISRRIWPVLLAGVVLTIGLVVWRQVALIPIADTHSHGDSATDDHLHTHDATFSHGHSHFGLRGEVTHSHPHVHQHEHSIDDQDVDIGKWEQIGHVHQGEGVAVFLARCQENDLQLTVSIAKYIDNELVSCDVQQKLLPTKVLVGSRQVQELLFQKDAADYVVQLENELIAHPALNLVVSNLRIGEQDLEFTLPILRKSETTSNHSLVVNQMLSSSDTEQTND